MAITVKHSKTSTIPDGLDTDLVRPSDWNADHTLTGLGTMAEQNASSVAITGGSVNGTSLGATTAASAKVTTLDIGSGLTLATDAGTAGQVLTSAGAGLVPTWTSNGAGDVVGPASSTDNAVARFDTTTGKLIQNSLVIVDDTGSVTGVNALTSESLNVNNNATLGSSNTDTLEINARITTDLEPNTDAAKDVGTSGRNWRDGYFSRNLQAEGKLVSPHLDALNSAGGSLRNASGTNQLQWGGGGGNNITFDVAANLNPANAQIDISPTGTGTVRINPATASSMNNVVIGATTPLAGSFTDLSVTGTTSFDGSQGTSGQVLTSAGTGATPTWTTPTTGTVTSVDLTASTGISVSGGPITSSGSITVTNTAPDQTVVLTAGTGISTSGTYPSFTVTNTAPDQTVAISSGTGISVSGTYPNFTVTNTSPSSGGTVTSVGGTGTVNGISLSGTVTSSGNLTLGGTLSGVDLTTQVTGTLPVANGGTGLTSLTANRVPYGNGTSALGNEADFTYDPSLNTVTAPQVAASNGIFVNSATVTASYSIPSGSNAMSAGVITIANGITVTIPNGNNWIIV